LASEKKTTNANKCEGLKKKMGCENYNLDSIKIFKEPNCHGDLLELKESGTFTIFKFKSIIIPKNYQVTMFKNNTSILYDYNIWNDILEDSENTFDLWENHKMLSFGDISQIEIQKLNDVIELNLASNTCKGEYLFLLVLLLVILLIGFIFYRYNRSFIDKQIVVRKIF
jgi:hypothetical protein